MLNDDEIDLWNIGICLRFLKSAKRLSTCLMFLHVLMFSLEVLEKRQKAVCMF